MKTELTIKGILRGSGTAQDKTEKIREVVTWKEDKLLEAINRIGTSSDKQRGDIIEEFWGK